jgi:hypothetical protein
MQVDEMNQDEFSSKQKVFISILCSLLSLCETKMDFT